MSRFAYGSDEVEVTTFQSRGWKEVAAGLNWFGVSEARAPWPASGDVDSWRDWLSHVPTATPDDEVTLWAERLAAVRVLVLRATCAEAAETVELTESGHRMVDLTEVGEWLDGLGARDVTALAIFRSGDRYELHVTELLLGHPVDHATGQPVTAPRVIDLGANATWPDSLNLAAFKPTRTEFLPAAREPEPQPVAA